MKFKINILFLTAMIIISFIPNIMADDIIKAKSVSKTASFTINGVLQKGLGDENLSTKHKVLFPEKIDIKSDTPIKNIYVIFDKPPKKWTLDFELHSKQQGEYGFLHELVTLNNPQKQFSVSFDKGTIIADIRLFSEGELPAYVQKWQPPLDDADMLLLPTHSDDEHVFFGGIMPIYGAERGYKIQVAYLNNHYAQSYRPHELLNGLWEVGIKNYPIIPDQFNDAYASSLAQAKTIYNSDKMLGYEVELLRRFKPEVVIGHDLKGEYGHGVHMLNAELLTKAVQISSDPTQYKESAAKYGVFDVPKTYLHLYNKNPLMLDIDTPLKSFDGLTAFEVSVKGFAQHKSQQEFFKVYKGGAYDCRKYGLFRTTVGVDVIGGDLFENIKVTSKDLVSSEITVPPSTVSSQPNKQIVSSEQTSKADHQDKSSFKNIFKNQVTIIFIIAMSIIILTIIIVFKKNNKNKDKNKKRWI